MAGISTPDSKVYVKTNRPNKIRFILEVDADLGVKGDVADWVAGQIEFRKTAIVEALDAIRKGLPVIIINREKVEEITARIEGGETVGN